MATTNAMKKKFRIDLYERAIELLGEGSEACICCALDRAAGRNSERLPEFRLINKMFADKTRGQMFWWPYFGGGCELTRAPRIMALQLAIETARELNRRKNPMAVISRYTGGAKL